MELDAGAEDFTLAVEKSAGLRPIYISCVTETCDSIRC